MRIWAGRAARLTAALTRTGKGRAPDHLSLWRVCPPGLHASEREDF